MMCLLRSHTHDDAGPPVQEWHECASCDGTGRDLDADSALDDVRFPACFDCGGEGGERIEVAATCSRCGASAIDVAMLEGP